MKMIYKIMEWEIMRNLKNKTFLLGLIITPLIFALFAGAPTLLERLDSPSEAPRYLIVDQLSVSENIEEIAQDFEVDFKFIEEKLSDKEEIQNLLNTKEAAGYFILTEDFINSGELKLYAEEHNYPAEMDLNIILTNLFQQQRIADTEIDLEEVEYLTAEANLTPTVVNEEQREATPENFILAIAITVILFILISSSGSMLLMSAMQEKRDKMSEVILSSISSDQLMAGKIIGHFILGIIQLVVWSVLALPFAWYFLELDLMEVLLTPVLPLLLLFAMLGYFMFAALFVGMGATMEDMQSASNTQGMVFMIPWLPVILIGPVFSNPNGLIAQIGSTFPLTSPIIMIARLGVTQVAIREIIISLVLLIITILLFIKLASKLFKVGMLMYCKTASIKEMWKWIRY